MCGLGGRVDRLIAGASRALWGGSGQVRGSLGWASWVVRGRKNKKSREKAPKDK